VRMIALLAALAIGLAPLASRAQDAGTVAPPPEAVGIPGQSVELAVGALAPFAGNLSDKDRWAYVLSLRVRAEKERDLLALDAQSAKAARDAAEAKATSTATVWAIVAGSSCLVVGLITGLVIGLVKTK
jgi:hypothetical protein